MSCSTGVIKEEQRRAGIRAPGVLHQKRMQPDSALLSGRIFATLRVKVIATPASSLSFPRPVAKL